MTKIEDANPYRIEGTCKWLSKYGVLKAVSEKFPIPSDKCKFTGSCKECPVPTLFSVAVSHNADLIFYNLS